MSGEKDVTASAAFRGKSERAGGESEYGAFRREKDAKWCVRGMIQRVLDSV